MFIWGIFFSVENVFVLKFSLTLFHLSLIMLLRARKVRSMRALRIWGCFQSWSTGRERRGGKGVVEDTCDLGEVCRPNKTAPNTAAGDGGRRSCELL